MPAQAHSGSYDDAMKCTYQLGSLIAGQFFPMLLDQEYEWMSNNEARLAHFADEPFAAGLCRIGSGMESLNPERSEFGGQSGKTIRFTFMTGG